MRRAFIAVVSRKESSIGQRVRGSQSDRVTLAGFGPPQLYPRMAPLSNAPAFGRVPLQPTVRRTFHIAAVLLVIAGLPIDASIRPIDSRVRKFPQLTISPSA